LDVDSSSKESCFQESAYALKGIRNDEVRKVLKAYISKNKLQYNDFLFPGKYEDAVVSYQQIWRVFQDAAQQLNIEDFGTHSLRKTWGYNAYKKTKNIGLLMKAFNHSSAEETLRYRKSTLCSRCRNSRILARFLARKEKMNDYSQ